jgi:hypothetical protein
MNPTFKSLDIEESFSDLMRKAYPEVPIGSAQYTESRLLFGAGAWIMFKHIKYAGYMLSMDAGAKELEQIEFQVDRFRNEFKK